VASPPRLSLGAGLQRCHPLHRQVLVTSGNLVIYFNTCIRKGPQEWKQTLTLEILMKQDFERNKLSTFRHRKSGKRILLTMRSTTRTWSMCPDLRWSLPDWSSLHPSRSSKAAAPTSWPSCNTLRPTSTNTWYLIYLQIKVVNSNWNYSTFSSLHRCSTKKLNLLFRFESLWNKTCEYVLNIW